ncbi:uncharacterized protein LOC124444839 [Xenia sp. Carnegie-2017]|uniref:uncharacterized protein LOC124444839 n=1 Tax=Xenia sp. Carnegie-2017 TaxID=2897299 RepID=UPI001F04EF46|nr:uncharacterized protein LOC124444839 [Xenia sp. Carnegie-2017]
MMDYIRCPADYYKPRFESIVMDEKSEGPPKRGRKISSTSQQSNDGQSWQHDMLIALRNSAIPEPIRIACMKGNVVGPPYFGEVYHGMLSRDEVTELLSGGNGRYLVRESQSSPGDHILSFSSNGNILHYKLFYEHSTAKFFTESDDKTYNSLTELMVDILEMLRVIHNYAGQKNGSFNEPILTSKKSSSVGKPHNFRIHQYMHPKWCDICHAFMWGLMHQGMKCQDCGLNVHKHCVKNVDSNCTSCAVFTKTRLLSRNKRRGRSSVKEQCKTNELYAVLEEHIHCSYQLECLKYLSSLGQPIEKFDLTTLMNPCYCDNCCQLKDLDTPLCKTGTPPKAYSLPLGWCRFKLSVSKEILDEVTTWNVAYCSISIDMFPHILQNGFGRKFDFMCPDGKVFIKLTPSIICADLDSSSVEYSDNDSSEVKIAKIALQVYVKPGSFQSMRRVGELPSDEIDPYFSSKDIYWIVREDEAVVPFGVLIKRMRTNCSSS